MTTVNNAVPVDGYGESLVSFGEAIGAANTAFDTKAATLGGRGVISNSNSLSTYVNGSNQTVYVCYIVVMVSAYDI